MSKHRNHPNFRTKVKHLSKDYQRGNIVYEDIVQWFLSLGLQGSLYDIPGILKSKVPSRIFMRLGKAALKKNAWIAVMDIIHHSYGHDNEGYHKIPFFRTSIETRTEHKETTYTTEVVCDLSGKVIDRSIKNRQTKIISETIH
jgi:hypothetical protein